MIYSCIIILLVLLVCSLAYELEVYRMIDFPKEKIALHMPCEESNMFATKCMCHIICTDSDCGNAKDICKKYSSLGCKYMLLRNVANKRIATLKRTPTQEEFHRFDPSMYRQDIVISKREQSYGHSRVTFDTLIDMVGIRGKKVVQNLIGAPTRKFCGSEGLNDTSLPPSADNLPWHLVENGISLFALSYRAPMTLLNSLRTWNSSGLLDYMDEKIMILNDPYTEEVAMSIDHGFQVLQPKDMHGAKVRKDNVLAIGASFYEALMRSRNEYILFLENDFKVDIEMNRVEIGAELIAALGMLNRGIEVIRLQSRKYKGCGTHKDCNHAGIHLDARNVMDRTRNWFSFYCRGPPGTEYHVADCLFSPSYRCFTSRDSNWSLNAILVKKSTMLNKKYSTDDGMKTIGQLALESFSQQDAFETNMMYGVKWMNWEVPMCISYQGLFIHEEIETAS